MNVYSYIMSKDDGFDVPLGFIEFNQSFNINKSACATLARPRNNPNQPFPPRLHAYMLFKLE